MIKVGGSSYNNGIKFIAKEYSVNFESSKEMTKIFLHKNKAVKKTSKLLDIMHKIPFIRGISLLIEDFKLLVILLFLDVITNTYLVNIEPESSLYKSLNFILSGILLIIWIITIWYLITKIFKKIKSTWQYHGAEHKVIYTNYENKEINLENCRKAPRISNSCGTMFVSMFLFSFVVINIIDSIFKLNMWFSVRFIISFVIAYELFLLKSNTPGVCLLFKLGYYFQKYVCTLEPTDLQLNQAIEAFSLLEKAETGQIPDDQLQELLKNGKQANFLTKLF